MKKLYYLLPVFLLALALPVHAKSSDTGPAANTATGQLGKPSPVPTGNKIQNEVRTQNEGEDTKLEVHTREQENNEEQQEGENEEKNEENKASDSSQNRSATATAHMSEVAAQVQNLLQIRTTGGIGEQVKEIANAQNQAQSAIQAELTKLNAKSKLSKFFTGTDLMAVKNLRQQMEQNRVRIQQLEQLMTQLANQGDITKVQEAVQTLTEANTSLSDTINAEEKVRSLFGWLIKLFQN